MSTLVIRKAAAKDAAALLKIYSYYIENTAITFEYEVPSVKEFKKRIITIQKKYPYLIAEKEGKILGYAYASEFKNRKAYNWAVETSIYVDIDYLHMGIGKKLYAELEEYLKKMNITNVNACIAYIEKEDEYLNNNSCKFHEHSGFKTTGHFTKCGYKFNRWYDMIWMEKIINEHKDNQPNIIYFKDL